MACLVSPTPAWRSVVRAPMSEEHPSAPAEPHPGCSLPIERRDRGAATFYTRSAVGPTGWRPVPDVYSTTFDPRLYVVAPAACATALWAPVALACSRRWD
jgi:hypothetical protein